MTFHDLELKTKIKGSLADDMSIRDAWKIDVDVHDGVVDLKGDVTQNEHDKALEITKSVKGVTEVQDHLNITE